MLLMLFKAAARCTGRDQGTDVAAEPGIHDAAPGVPSVHADGEAEGGGVAGGAGAAVLHRAVCGGLTDEFVVDAEVYSAGGWVAALHVWRVG